MSKIFDKHTVNFLFESAHIQRWNEFIRPQIGLSELDKQAHKAIIMFVLAGLERDAGNHVDELKLINGFLYEFFERTLLTDIKPPIFRKLLDTSANELHGWAISELQKRAPELHHAFGEDMRAYLFDYQDISLERKILKAAHYLSSRYELYVIAPQNENVYGFMETKNAIEKELEEHYALISVQKIELAQKSRSFIDLLGRLRFQKRWTSTPRTPETSVMSHMLITAVLSFISVKTITNACDARLINAFFGGLFHDIPEVLTRDIISPIKRNVAGLDKLISNIEHTLIQEELLPICPNILRKRLQYYIVDEFANKVSVDNKLLVVESINELHQKYNHNQFDPIDGDIINACDKLSAYFEACVSVVHGVKSVHLLNAISYMREANKNLEILGIDFGNTYTSFPKEHYA